VVIGIPIGGITISISISMEMEWNGNDLSGNGMEWNLMFGNGNWNFNGKWNSNPKNLSKSPIKFSNWEI